MPMRVVARRVMATWRGPPTRAARLIRRSLSKENSIPSSEEEEDDPNFGEELYLFDLLDEPEAVGAGDDPRQQEPHHHRDPEPRTKEDGDDRDEEDHYDVVEDGYGHPSALPPHLR